MSYHKYLLSVRYLLFYTVITSSSGWLAVFPRFHWRWVWGMAVAVNCQVSMAMFSCWRAALQVIYVYQTPTIPWVSIVQSHALIMSTPSWEWLVRGHTARRPIKRVKSYLVLWH
jgi:hypothetical protein